MNQNKGNKTNVNKDNLTVEEEESIRNLMKMQTGKIEEENMKIKSPNLGRVGNIFKMKDVIKGPKKGMQEPTAVKDPNSGDFVVYNEEIKKVTLAYCVNDLQKKKSESLGLQVKKLAHDIRIEDEEDDDHFYINWEDYRIM